MILQALNEYYERKTSEETTELAPIGFEKKEIPFVIVLDREGRFRDLEDTRTGESKKKTGRLYTVPQGEKRTVAVLANLLWDNISYVLGAVNAAKIEKLSSAKLEKERQRTQQMQAAFIQRIRDSFPGPDSDPGVKAVLSFLEKGDFKTLFEHPLWQDLCRSTGNISFRLENDMELICQREAVRQVVTRPRNDDDRSLQRCLVSGERDAIARLHPSVKGVWGAQTAGANIVSFNLDAFNSYGKTQGLNAPVGERAAFAYTTALNHLLRKGSRQRIQVGDASTAFWAERSHPLEEQLLDWIEPDQDDPDRNTAAVRSLYSAPWTGASHFDDEDTRFYVLGLAPNAARVAVRFWHRSTVSELARHIRQHFEDISLVHSPFEPEYLALSRLLKATAMQGKAENIPPNLAGEVIKAILAGTRYPWTLLAATIRRIRAERRISYPRAALVKAVLLRNNRLSKQDQKEVEVSLDEQNMNIGYRLGRLFAALEYAQMLAAGSRKIDATIRDRFYGAASATPVAAFPHLLKLKNHHLEKLEPGQVIWMEGIIGRIMEGIDQFPAHLKLDDQGRFAIGYYHQRQTFYTKKDIKDVQKDIQGETP